MTDDTPSSPRRGRVLLTPTSIACCLAVCIAQAAIAIPSTLNGLFQSDLRTTGSELSWISSATLMPVAVLGLTFGVLGDLFGRKRLLIGGAVLLAAGEAVSASANSVPALVASQALAGIGAAAVMPSSLAMIAAEAHTPRQRAVVIAAWSAFLAGGGFVAPVLGGVTGEHGSRRWAFVVMAALGLVTALVALGARNSTSRPGRSLDLPGQITVGVGVFALLYAVIQGPTDGWSSGVVVTAFITGGAGLLLFVAAERRSPAPLLRLSLFRNRSFAVAAVVAVIGMFSFIGTVYSLSIRLGPIQHQEPMRIGIAFLFTNGPTLLLAPITARLLQRVSAGWLLSAGFLSIAAGDLLLARLPITDRALPSLVLPLALVGLGFTLAISSVTASAVNTVPEHLQGMASGTTSQLRDFGFMLGPAIIGAVALSQAARHFQAALAASPLPDGLKAAAGQIAAEGGPLAVNSLPPDAPPAAAGPLAFAGLGDGYSTGFVICAAAALFSSLLAVLVLRGRPQVVTAVESGPAETPSMAGA
jgi:MFS family permease